MTGKTLKEMVGGNLRVDLSEDGFTVTNGAGTAHYDKWGYRTTVNGIPEYFPVTFAVSGWDNLPKKQAAELGDIDVKGPFFINEAMISSGIVNHSRKMNIAVNTGTSDKREMKSPDELSELVIEIIKNQQRPGGLLFRK